MRFKNNNSTNTIVCIHGNSGSSKHYENVLNADIDSNFVLIDLPGHGNNKHNHDQEDYTIPNYKKAILEAIKEVDGDVIIVGHSYGGHLAIEIAPEITNLKALMIFGAPPVKKPINMDEAFLPFPFLPVFFTPEPSNEEIENLISSLVFNTNTINQITEDFKNSDPLVRAKAGIELTTLTNVSNEYQILKDLACKKVVLVGQYDPVVNGEYLSQIKDKCNFDLIEFPDCGHYITLEQPQEFIDQLNLLIQNL